jgi:hypothetical protein
MADIEPKQLRENCQRRLAGMKQVRIPWEPQWASVSEYTQPRRSRFLCYDGTGQVQGSAKSWRDAQKAINTKIIDGTGRQASRTLGNGLASGLTSPSRPWFRLTTYDPDMAKRAQVKVWLSAVQDKLYDLFNTTNFYAAAKAGFHEQGLFGTEATLFTPHWRTQAVAQSLTAGEYWLGVSETLEVDSLYRLAPMTVAQMVQKFGDKVSQRVKNLYDRQAYDENVPVMHAIEPNPERIPGMLDKTNMVYRSIYWEPDESSNSANNGVLAFEGFKQKPFWAARWEPMGNSPYSGSPGQDALGDMRQLQLQQLDKSKAIQYGYKPPLRFPISMETRHINNIPGGITFIPDMVQQNSVGPLTTISMDIGDLREDIKETQQQVRDAFYYDMFLAIMDQDREITATEANLLADEKWGQLGPVIDANLNEKLSTAVAIGFNILATTNQLPPWPPEMGAAAIKVEFVSVLAQLQRAAEITAIEQTIAFTGQVAAAQPQAWDNIDTDALIEVYGDLRGVPPQIIRAPDMVSQLRQQRAQQEQAAQLQQAAPAAKDGATAAQVLAGIKPGGGDASLLDQLMQTQGNA